MVLIIYNCFGSPSGPTIPYDKEPFYAVLFSIALLILIIGYYRKRRLDSGNTPVLNSDFDIQQFDVIGQPQVNHYKSPDGK